MFDVVCHLFDIACCQLIVVFVQLSLFGSHLLSFVIVCYWSLFIVVCCCFSFVVVCRLLMFVVCCCCSVVVPFEVVFCLCLFVLRHCLSLLFVLVCLSLVCHCVSVFFCGLSLFDGCHCLLFIIIG